MNTTTTTKQRRINAKHYDIIYPQSVIDRARFLHKCGYTLLDIKAIFRQEMWLYVPRNTIAGWVYYRTRARA